MDAPTPSVSRGRQIPAELLSFVCEQLAAEGERRTLSALLQTGSLGYSVASLALYTRLTIDNSIHALLAGLERRGYAD